jgi:CubicO group peptidase (beta-lactamase class C family)
MDEWQLPGGQLAIVRGDRVLIDRAYGLAAPGVAMQPRARMRIASVSKTFTAAAVHLLVAEGRLSLDEPALPRLHLGTPPVDPRWSRITVRQLLEHSAGFDRHESRDWTFESRYIARELGLERPPELREIVGFVARLPLDFEPGSDVAYSNLGYSILGLVIEDAAGMPYERFVTERLLAPSGLERIVAGRTRREQRPDDEVSYFPHESEALSESVFGGAEPVPTPDGGFYIEPMLAHGGWIASAVDVARFMTRLDALPEPADFFDAANLEGMIAPPTSHHVVDGEDTFYAHGLIVSRKVTTGDRVWLHDGSKPGTTSFAVRFEDGTVAVALFNGRPVEGNVSAAIEELLRDALRTLPPADREEARRE